MAENPHGAKRRHPAGTGYARGEQKRGRLLAAAIEIFGARGYEGATTRSIAERAKVPPTALQYYFGGKEALYETCDAYIAERAAARLYPILMDIQETLGSPDVSRKQLLDLATGLTDGLIEFLFAFEQTESWVLFVIRTELAGEAGSKSAQFRRRVIDALSSVIARATSSDATDPAVVVRALSLYGSIMTFRVARGLALRSLGWDSFGPRRLPVLKRELRAHLKSILT